VRFDLLPVERGKDAADLSDARDAPVAGGSCDLKLASDPRDGGSVETETASSAGGCSVRFSAAPPMVPWQKLPGPWPRPAAPTSEGAKVEKTRSGGFMTGGSDCIRTGLWYRGFTFDFHECERNVSDIFSIVVP